MACDDMISFLEAHNLVVNSLTDLEQQSIVRLTTDDIVTDVTCVACKWIIEQCPKLPIMHFDPNMVYADNYKNFYNIAFVFPSSVEVEYPIVWQNAENMAKNICLFIGWIGIFRFLDDYFETKHNMIGGNYNIVKIFISSYHKRFQSCRLIEQSVVQRKIELFFSEDYMKLAVSITPVLSRKLARLVSHQNNRSIYEGSGYRFRIYFNEFDEVEFFSLELLERELELEYYQ